jgi:hypothetical protein
LHCWKVRHRLDGTDDSNRLFQVSTYN